MESQVIPKPKFHAREERKKNACGTRHYGTAKARLPALA
jgi:hypothetical protein